ncbi:hypothetical protein F2Q70_00012650 [Brassica cretica]|uniref:RNase H type-1 domain-containing protein n=1 Tax=Brassica cretica TaxID=69181 RepID=A0A8S9J6I8_BRACR|nr:hypothetical protein F2Q68_00005742 [Brassica cretica]KAF2612550.1 hypothetical protein F2Q70_00012650 [Brassica cretica]
MTSPLHFVFTFHSKNPSHSDSLPRDSAEKRQSSQCQERRRVDGCRSGRANGKPIIFLLRLQSYNATWIFNNRATSMEHQGSSASDHVSSVLMAEALAVRAALQSAILLDISTIKTHDNEIYGAAHDIRNLSALFASISFVHVSRTQNVRTDTIAKTTLRAFNSAFMILRLLHLRMPSRVIFLFIVNSDPGANQPAESMNLFLMEFFRFCNYDHLMLMASQS